MYVVVSPYVSKDLATSRGGESGESSSSSVGVFELRTYQLELGYNPIPKLIGHMVEGLPSKLASDPGVVSGGGGGGDGDDDHQPKGRLVFMGYSDVGKLNQFVELWRYPSFQDHILVREGARTADKWRKTIGEIAPMVQMFDTKLVKPASFSPLK